MPATSTPDGHGVIRCLYHPTFLTSSREALAEFFLRVFGVHSDYQRDLSRDPRMRFNEDYPTDYSLFTWVADVWFDAIQPELYTLGGKALTLEPLDQLSEIGWIIYNTKATFDACSKTGIRVYDQHGHIIGPNGIEALSSAVAPDVHLMWMSAEDAGLTVELVHMPPDTAEGHAQAFKFWPLARGYAPRKPEPVGPLGITHASHHTFLTDDRARARRLMVDTLGGKIVSERRNPVLQTQSSFFQLADGLIEYAEPLSNASASHAALMAKPRGLNGHLQQDVYHSITFVVQDLQRARRHLQEQGVGLEYEAQEMIVTDPRDCLGMRWGFVSGPML